MNYWRSGTFWASLIFGWFVTMFVLAVLISIFGSEDMTVTEGVIINVVHQLLSLAAGYAYGRQQFQLRKLKQAGFPVIPKNDDDSAAR